MDNERRGPPQPDPFVELAAALRRALEAVIASEVRKVVREELRDLLLTSGNGVRTREHCEYLTVQEAADRAAVHEITIRRWIKDGSLKASRRGRVLRIDANDLTNCMSQTAADASDADVEQRAREILSGQRPTG
jgi:excisionase family DNA binding protein